MKSEDLSAEVDRFIREVQDRVLGTGNDQYSEGDVQKFEKMDLMQLIGWMDEEIQDIAAYATMLSIRLARVKKVAAMQNLAGLANVDFDVHNRGNCGINEIGICTGDCRRKNIGEYFDNVGKDFC